MWKAKLPPIHKQNNKLVTLDYNIDITVFSDPEKNIAQLGLKEGDQVADLGAGVGFYSAAAGNLVGTSGQVYAVEVQKDLLDRLTDDMKHRGVHNVKVVWGDIEHEKGTRLRDNSIDAVLVCNVLFQIEDRAGMLSEIKRIIRPAGKVMIVDWSESFGGMGPRPEKVLPIVEAKSLFERAGFQFEKDLHVGEHHYGFVVKLP